MLAGFLAAVAGSVACFFEGSGTFGLRLAVSVVRVESGDGFLEVFHETEDGGRRSSHFGVTTTRPRRCSLRNAVWLHRCLER